VFDRLFKSEDLEEEGGTASGFFRELRKKKKGRRRKREILQGSRPGSSNLSR